MNWRIYYEGGSTFDESMGSPSDAPATGVVAIVQRNDCSHHPTEWLKLEPRGNSQQPVELLEGLNWFWWREDQQRWYRGDMLGFLDQAMHCGARYLKQGRYVSHNEWESLVPRMSNDRLE